VRLTISEGRVVYRWEPSALGEGSNA
jgi:hypothetical protein